MCVCTCMCVCVSLYAPLLLCVFAGVHVCWCSTCLCGRLLRVCRVGYRVVGCWFAWLLPSLDCLCHNTNRWWNERIVALLCSRTRALSLSLSLSLSVSPSVCVSVFLRYVCVCALLLLLFVLRLPRLPRWRLENVDTLFVKEHSVTTTDNGEKVESSLAKFQQNEEITVSTVQRRISTLRITLGRSNCFMAEYDNNPWRADQWVCSCRFALTISSRLISHPLFGEPIDHPTYRDWLWYHSILSLRTINNARTKGLSKWYSLVGLRLYASEHVNETVGLPVRSNRCSNSKRCSVPRQSDGSTARIPLRNSLEGFS